MHCRDKAASWIVSSSLDVLAFVLLRSQDGKWSAEKVISVPSKKVENWALPDMPGFYYTELQDHLKTLHVIG